MVTNLAYILVKRYFTWMPRFLPPDLHPDLLT